MRLGQLVCALLAVAATGCTFDGGGLPADGDGGADARGNGDGGNAPDAGNERTTLGFGDMRLGLGIVASDRIHARRWDGGDLDWEDDDATPATAGSPLWPITAIGPGPDPDELLAAQLRRIGGHRFVVHSWNGESWVPDFSANTALTLDSKRGFDIAFERESGDAIAVYVNDTHTPAYRVREAGGPWSPEAQLPLNDGPGLNPDTNLGIVHWIELESHPGSDHVGLVFADSNRDLVAMVWNGSQWLTTSAKTLETNLKQNPVTLDVANRVFDLAFESQSGDLMVAWGQQTESWPWYQMWSRDSGQWLDQAIREDEIVAGTPHFVDLEAEPGSDRIAGGFFDLGDGIERAGLGIWNGTVWIEKREVDSQIRDVDDTAIGDQPGAVAWLHATGVAVMVYADDQKGTLDWGRWDQNRGWTLENDVAFGDKGFTESIAIRATPDGDRLVVLLSDETLALFTSTYNGASWQVTNDGAPLTTLLAAGDAVSFSLDVRR